MVYSCLSVAWLGGLSLDRIWDFENKIIEKNQSNIIMKLKSVYWIANLVANYTWNMGFTIVVHLPSCVWLFVTPWTAAHEASLSITNSQSWLKLMSIESVMTSNHLILCCPLLVLPSIFPSIRVFLNGSVLHIRWPKYWSFSISPWMNEYLGLISFRKLTGLIYYWFTVISIYVLFLHIHNKGYANCIAMSDKRKLFCLNVGFYTCICYTVHSFVYSIHFFFLKEPILGSLQSWAENREFSYSRPHRWIASSIIIIPRVVYLLQLINLYWYITIQFMLWSLLVLYIVWAWTNV